MGITLPGKKDYSSYRADVTISDIDTEQDVEKQIQDALEALTKVDTAVEEATAQATANASGLSIEGVGLAAEFATFKEKYKARENQLVETLKKIIDKQKEQEN
jgi:hypothetical protein